MDNRKLGDGLKKLVLLGIGVAAVTGEKSQEIIEKLVKKGEITMEDGKVLNSEFSQNVKDKVKEAAETVKTARDNSAERKEVQDKIRTMTSEQVSQIKEFIKTHVDTDELKEKAENVMDKAGDAAEKLKEAAGEAVKEFTGETGEDYTDITNAKEGAWDAACDEVKDVAEDAKTAVKEAAEEAVQDVEENVD